jgi:hypothetical protein
MPKRSRRSANVTAPDKSAAGADVRNVWNVVILVLVGAAIIGGFVMTQVAVEPIRTGSFWLLMLIGGAMVVSAVGWGYTEIRIQERLSPKSERTSDARRILGYVGVLIVVAAIAVAGAMVPARLAPAIWAIYIPIWLFGGWWVRRRRDGRKFRRGRP